MPSKTTKARAQRARREGKAPTTQAGAFVREEMEHVRRGKHGAKSRKQSIAIGLSKARRAGVKVPRRGKRTGAKGGSRSGARSRTRSRRGARAGSRRRRT
jgi:hypothetical protein